MCFSHSFQLPLPRRWSYELMKKIILKFWQIFHLKIHVFFGIDLIVLKIRMETFDIILDVMHKLHVLKCEFLHPTPSQT